MLAANPCNGSSAPRAYAADSTSDIYKIKNAKKGDLIVVASPSTFQVWKMYEDYTISEADVEGVDYIAAEPCGVWVGVDTESGIVNVNEFDALGGGVEDESAQMQAALTAGAGGIVFFPQGIYKTTATLTVSTNTTIIANGAIIIEAAGSHLEPVVSISGDNVVVVGLSIQSAESVGIWDDSKAQTRVGVSVVGNDCALILVTVVGKSTGFRASSALRCKFDKCASENTWLTDLQVNYNLSSGILINSLANDSTVEGAKITGHGQGVLVGSATERVKIGRNTINNSVDNGIYLSSAISGSVTHNTIVGHAHNGIKMRGSLNNASDNQIDGGNIGVVISPLDGTADVGTPEADYSTLTGFNFNGFGSSVIGNKIKNASTRGVDVTRLTTSGGIYFHGAIVRDNIFEQCGDPGNPYGTAVAGVLAYGHDHSITGNKISGSFASAYGILVTTDGTLGPKAVTISDNDITAQNMVRGISAEGANLINIFNNRVHSVATYAITASDCTTPTIAWNQCVSGVIRLETTPSTGVEIHYNVANTIGFAVLPTSGNITHNTSPNLSITATGCYYNGNSRNGSDFYYVGGRKHYFGTTAPSAGAWVQGDLVWNIAPTAGGKVGWICTTAGSPGTWKEFGAIDP